MRATINIEILSCWHAGSGLGRAGFVDAQALRDNQGLPYLPGRTLKGLLREGVQLAADAGQLPSQRQAANIFGQGDDAAHATGAAPDLFIGDATLDAPTRAWFAQPGNQAKKEYLFLPFASTRLDEHGLAEDHTLRLVELAVPLELAAQAIIPDPATLLDLETGASLVRWLGSYRHRGLGRCRITITPLPENQ